MTRATLKVPGRSLRDWLREISARKLTGKLVIATATDGASLYFVAGELYLAPEHSLFEAAKAWRRSPEPPPDGGDTEASAAPGRPQEAIAFRELADRLLDLLGGPEVDDCEFTKGAGQIRIDLTGPLPTSQLLMESAVRGRDVNQLLRRLGGEKTRLLATAVGQPLSRDIELDPEEAFLLSRLEQPVAVGELMRQVEMDRRQVLERLCRLLAVDLVAPADETATGEESLRAKTSLAQRFALRVQESLEREALTVKPEQHRELLRSLIARMGEMSHYELLAVKPHSTQEEVHKAFFELGRLIHPVHSERLELVGGRGVLSILFERATEAYLTLSDPDRRARYFEEIGPYGRSALVGPSQEQVLGERREMARRHYEMALALAARQEFHSAIQLLEQAVRAHPQVEYYALLGDCQAENPRWLDRAAAAYRKAIELRPDDPSPRARLGQALERLGRTGEARKLYESVLQLSPDSEEARAGLRRVGAGRDRGAPVGLKDRLRSWVRRRTDS